MTKKEKEIASKLDLILYNLKMHLILEGHSELFDIIKRRCYFAGGCIRSILRNEVPKDYDMFFYSEEGIIEFETEARKIHGMFKIYNPEINTYTMKTTAEIFQFITIAYGNPEIVTSKFDFKNNMNYYAFNGDTGPVEVKKDVMCRSDWLKFNEKCDYPYNALGRTIKFQKRGYKIHPYELGKIAIACSKINVKSYDDLEHLMPGMSS